MKKNQAWETTKVKLRRQQAEVNQGDDGETSPRRTRGGMSRGGEGHEPIC